MRRAILVTGLGGALLAGAPAAVAQNLNDLGRVLQDQVLGGGRGNQDREREAYERGRQDQAREREDRRRFDDERRRREEDLDRRQRDLDRQRYEDQRARDQQRRY